MSQDRETNLALFIDFDNVAIGARDSGQRFEIKLLLQRLLEKGKIIAKKAYADWHFYKEYMSPLHEAAIELIEIPMPKISGKNSADIKLVVDAMDLCYSKDHIDTFVIVSGDSDFSPLVSKLRENNKRVIGVGVKNSSSRLLIGNCDEFIFYDDIYRQRSGRLSRSGVNVPSEKRDLFDFLVKTVQSLLLESRGVLYSSLIKDTMTRKQPDFNERAHGYSTFGDLLEEARELGLLKVDRDAQAGGTWVVKGLGEGIALEKAGNGDGSSRPSRRRRRSGRGGGSRDRKDTPATGTKTETAAKAAQPQQKVEGKPTGKAAASKPAGKPQERHQEELVTRKAPARKAPAKKSTTKNVPTKKTTTKMAAGKKPVAKQPVAKKAPTKKTAKKVTKKTSKAPTKKTVKKNTKKAASKPAAVQKTSRKK
jgi:uncharacterized protein (TIGR00288 family)